MNDRVAIHLGVAWKMRNWHHLGEVVVHAVERPEGVSAERLPDGRVGWDKPWERICDGGPADERRTGWTDNVTCAKCRRALAETSME